MNKPVETSHSYLLLLSSKTILKKGVKYCLNNKSLGHLTFLQEFPAVVEVLSQSRSE